MVYTYTLKQVLRTAYPPPKTHSSTKPLSVGDTIEASDGNWYHVVSVQSKNDQVQLNVGPDGMDAEEAELLAQQHGLIG
jgi:hypothetical protein